jgi:D-alanine-D-alanine ligase
MGHAPSDLTQYIQRLSPDEIDGTHVLFHTRHATNLTRERFERVGYTARYHAAVLNALRSIGLQVTPASDPKMLFGELDFDYIYFTQIEDSFLGHELLIPCLAAFREIPFLGPPAPMRGLSEDKVLAKAVAASLGIEVAKHELISPVRTERATFSLPGRWVLKPRNGVMSEGVAFIDSKGGWRDALSRLVESRHADREFIAEEFVPGLNLTVPVIEGFPPQSFPVFAEHGDPKQNILTESSKEGLSSGYVSEPYFGPGAAEASAAAARLARILSPFDYARFDFRFDPERNRLVFLEVNMNCAMGPGAVVTRAAEMCGLDYQTLIGHVFAYSLRRQMI